MKGRPPRPIVKVIESGLVRAREMTGPLIKSSLTASALEPDVCIPNFPLVVTEIIPSPPLLNLRYQTSPFNSDTKIRIHLPGHTRFYYPDASLVFRSNPPKEVFQDASTVVVEVLSDSIRRLGLGEKKDA